MICYPSNFVCSVLFRSNKLKCTPDYTSQFLSCLRLIKIHGFCHSSKFSSSTYRSNILNHCSYSLSRFFILSEVYFYLTLRNQILLGDILIHSSCANQSVFLLCHTFLNLLEYVWAHYLPFFYNWELYWYFDIVENIQDDMFLFLES